VTDAAKDYLGKEGYKEEYGARQLRRVIQNRVEDKLSDAVLRGGFKTFDRVYETKATVKTPGVMDDITKAIKEIPDKRAAEKSEDKYRVVPEIKAIEATEDSITVYATESIKYELEKILKEALEEKGKVKAGKKAKVPEEIKVTENAYVSEVMVDMTDEEIIIDSRDDFSPTSIAVSAKA
jgi:DNA primase catalytic subunit